MSRVIKFRARDKMGKIFPNCRMVVGFDLYMIFAEMRGIAGRGGIAMMANDPNQFDFMQFTGLLDKNGKEIYEGDILYVNSAFNAEVQRHGDGSWRLQNGQLSGGHLYREHDRLEVTGNIYENPELLSKEEG